MSENMTSIKKLRTMLDSKEISAAELTNYYLDNINKQDAEINSYITVNENAVSDAKTVQQKIDSGNSGLLTGIPISIKDNICTKSMLTTCASKILENFTPPFDATVVERLTNDGAVVLGKVNLDEFAMGASTGTSYYGTTKNPYDTTRVPGGSSGGSAAGVAAKLAVASLGSDTGGSVRQPASFCGVTGIKPTYGAVSRYGLVAFASSLDQIGPIAHSAEDCAFILNVISGHDSKDSTSSKMSGTDYTEKLGKSVKGLKLAVPTEFFADGISPSVKSAVLSAVEVYRTMGAEIIEVSMPSLKYAIPAYYLISSAEASSNLARYDGVKYGFSASDVSSYEDLITKTRAEGFGDEVKRRILLGTYALSSGYYDDYYKKAALLRQRIKSEYLAIFESADAIITPTAPTTAPKIGEHADDPVSMYLADIYTVTVNIAGLPAISTTCGYDEGGLPIGMSIVGREFDESTILQLADVFESGFDYKTPKIL